MSGSKATYVTMEQRRAQRLLEMETHFRAVQQDLPERLRELRQEMQTELGSQRRRMDQRWREMQAVTKNLSKEIAAVERRNQESLQKGLENLRSQTEEAIASERADRFIQAAKMRREYHSLVDEERVERQRQFGQLQDQVNRIEGREQNRHQMAEAWLQDLRKLQGAVAALPHARFAPGRMARLEAMIDQGENNLRLGASQAALVNAQNCYLDLIELRAEVLYQEQIFEQAFLEATAAVKALLAEVNAHQTATAHAGTPDEFSFEVDFWSKGRLSQVNNDLKTLEQRLADEKEKLSLDQVQALAADVEKHRGELLAAVESAKVAIVNGQACYNVSQIVENVLEEQGFRVDDGVYEGEDQRAAYALKMSNLNGDEVVTPSPDRELEYKLEMNFFDRSQDEAMRRTFASAVYNGLQKAGLQAAPLASVRGVDSPNEAVRDFEKFRERKEVNVTQFATVKSKKQR
jgi:hypothetical protein